MQHNVVGLMVVLGADLTLINTLVHRPNVLDDEAPFVHSLVVVDANASVRCEREQTDCQRVNFVITLPRHLRVQYTYSLQTLNIKMS